MENNFNLKKQTALITGGNTGIGLGIAKAFAKAYASVIIIGRDTNKNKTVLKRLSGINKHCYAYNFDLANTDKIEDFYSNLCKKHKNINILVNNAGVQIRDRADKVNMEDFEHINKINLIAPYKLSQCFAKECIENKKGGSIIMIASLMSEASRPGTSAYTASKGGIRQLVKALAVDWAQFGIRVNGIGPGYIKTEMTKPLYNDKKFSEWVKSRTPQKKWGIPEDIGNTAVFFASKASSFITGQILYVDGGWLASL